MPKLVECMHNGQVLGIKEALRMRDEARVRKMEAPHFECASGHRVYAHRTGTTNQAAHFEHRSGAVCS